ncbi:DUF6933 domain-containing protein [Persicobacter psychrovividus]|uniref:DUF6933 domain-containing protein n=1 Tax=Persicobacter psychrovividus TaxID=387638 RepID=A0ABM7VD40_9BACT|nr:hypothetical protein PEPS_11090 [Persicobacter psychrovividus]
MIFSCTQIVNEKITKLYPIAKEKPEPHIYNWYVNQVSFGRQKGLIITNALTLYTLYYPKATMPIFRNFEEVFKEAFLNTAQKNELSQEVIDMYFENSPEKIVITKTNSDQVIHAMNEMAKYLQEVQTKGGDLEAEAPKLNHLEYTNIERNKDKKRPPIEVMVETLQPV